MKIATWNINSVRLRSDLVKKIHDHEEIDVLLIQETKTENHFFPSDILRSIGFKHQYYEGEKSYNGVAILSKIPFENNFSLSFVNQDKRHVSVTIKGIEIHNFYIPAGGDIPDPDQNPKFAHKLLYLKELKDWFLKNRNKNDSIILAGDLNIAPFEHDVWSSKQLKNEVSHTDIERQILLDISNSFGWKDIARNFISHDQKLYSWWSYRNIDWKKSNRGRRLDHIWLSTPLETKCNYFKIMSEARDWGKPSDHVPVIAKIVI